MSTWNKSISLLTLLLVSVMAGCTGTTRPAVESSPTISAIAVIDTATAVPAAETVEPEQAVQETTAEPAVTEISQDSPVITLSNAARLAQTASIDIVNPASILWVSDSKSLTVTSPGVISRIDANGWKITKEFSPEGENTRIVDMSPDGATVAVTSDQIVLDLMDIDSGQKKYTLDIPEMLLDASFSADGHMIAIASAEEIAAQLWDAEDGSYLKTLTGFETAAPVYGFAFTPDNRSLLWVSRAKAQLMDIESGSLGQEFYHEDFIANAVVSPNGKWLVCSTAATVDDLFSPVILIRNAASGEQIGIIVTIAISSIAISPNSTLLAAGNGPYLFVWNLETQEELAILDGISPGITAVAFSPDGRTIATTAQDNTIRFWQVTE